MMREDRIIDFLKRHFPEHIGDDAAVIPLSHEPYMISQDALIEDVHFRCRYQSAESLAHKALHVNLSDMAAMGAKPRFVLLSLSASPTASHYVLDFLKAFVVACQAHDVQLIGGDTTRSPGPLCLNVTILGTSQGSLKYRHQAQPGDHIYISGPLGHAHLGLTALERNQSGFEYYKQCFLTPTARVAEGQWLAQQKAVHAMMDLSDGLSLDLKKLIQASHCDAIIDLENWTYSEEESRLYHTLDLSPLETTLTGGEDYALLLTVDPHEATTLSTHFQNVFGTTLKYIGHIESCQQDPHIHYRRNGRTTHLNLKPFEHF